MSTSHLLLSYSRNVLRPLAQNSNDKDTIYAKIKRYEGIRNSRFPVFHIITDSFPLLHYMHQISQTVNWTIYLERTRLIKTML